MLNTPVPNWDLIDPRVIFVVIFVIYIFQLSTFTMPTPSKLSIATSSVLRLVREEASYHKELEQQEAHVKQLEREDGSDDQNAEFKLRQEVKQNRRGLSSFG